MTFFLVFVRVSKGTVQEKGFKLDFISGLNPDDPIQVLVLVQGNRPGQNRKIEGKNYQKKKKRKNLII